MESTSIPGNADSNGIDQELLLQLNFVPQWARKPPEQNHFAGEGGAPAPALRDRRDRPDRRKEMPRRDRPARREWPAPRPRPEPLPQAEELPSARMRVSFIPEREVLGALVKQIRAAQRAYPLFDLGTLLLETPAHFHIKLEYQPVTEAERQAQLHQCKSCRAVFETADSLQAHLLRKHLDEYFTTEEVDGEPPAGNFAAVGRCRLSGQLLGPPNHHMFQERFRELHQSRFPHLSEEAYRANIDMVRDPAVVEQWKESVRKTTVYHPKDEPALALTRKEAEDRFIAGVSQTLRIALARCILPATVAVEMESSYLKSLIRDTWERETRRPFSMLLALRPALKHMHFCFFKANQQVFVTAIQPKPLDPAQAIAPIREVLEYLSAKPGCTRRQLAEQLRPGCAPDSKEVLEVVNPLRWLVDKGHVIEFFNGTLSVPLSNRPAPARGSQPPVATGGAPAPTA